MTEREILHAVLRALGSRPDCRVWRNSVGVAVEPSSGRVVRFGVRGSSDVLGILSGSGRLVSIEVKAPSGRVSQEQQTWLDMVARFGGLSVVARSAADAVNAIEEAK